jgi:hypothetical protein
MAANSKPPRRPVAAWPYRAGSSRTSPDLVSALLDVGLPDGEVVVADGGTGERSPGYCSATSPRDPSATADRCHGSW